LHGRPPSTDGKKQLPTLVLDLVDHLFGVQPCYSLYSNRI